MIKRGKWKFQCDIDGKGITGTESLAEMKKFIRELGVRGRTYTIEVEGRGIPINYTPRKLKADRTRERKEG